MSKQRLRCFENSPLQRHIGDTDRYLLKSPDSTHNLVVIGTGTMGQEHMHVAYLLGRARIHGIYDSHQTSLVAAEKNYRTHANHQLVRYRDLESACSDPDVDALMICTPNHTHYEILTLAMKSGKPIFLEKPMATTIGDTAAIVRASEGYSSFIQIGLQYRYKAQYVEAFHEAKSRSSLGQIKTISLSEYRPPFLDKVEQWNKFNKNSGGTLVEKCCHYFDLINQLAESMPTRVYASGGQAVNFKDFDRNGIPADIDDHAFVITDYANGIRANFTLNMFCHDFTEEMVISGDKGQLKAKEQFKIQEQQPSRATITLQLGEWGGSRKTDVTYAREIEESGHHGATFYAHVAFMDHLEGKHVQAATPLQGLWSMIVAFAAQQSIETGQSVDIREFMIRNNLDEYIE